MASFLLVTSPFFPIVHYIAHYIPLYQYITTDYFHDIPPLSLCTPIQDARSKVRKASRRASSSCARVWAPAAWLAGGEMPK